MAITVVDNRETCTNPTPSACVPYTGYISDSIKDALPCKPNINDIVAQIQDLIDKINLKLGDNTSIDIKCLPNTLDIAEATQKEINQSIIDSLCTIDDQIGAIAGDTDANNLNITIDLSCLEDPACEDKLVYKLIEVLNKLVANYCDLNTRVNTIEQLLNI